MCPSKSRFLKRMSQVLLMMAAFAGGAHAANRTDARVLFIGNSLTYVNDLPSAFASLASPGMHVRVDMIARGGASLGDYADDGIVREALAHGRYTAVILQERGGEAFCETTCQHAVGTLAAERPAIRLADAARASGARVFYLGTWQMSKATNDALKFGERRIARAAGATYIEIAEPRRALMLSHPSLAWTHADGQHPGYATTAMLAWRTWAAVFAPSRRIPCVAGPLHDHAPLPKGVYHVDASATPITCLVPPEVAGALAGRGPD
jgi:hypothetical protein